MAQPTASKASIRLISVRFTGKAASAAVRGERHLSVKSVGLLFLNHFHVSEKIVSFLLFVHGPFIVFFFL